MKRTITLNTKALINEIKEDLMNELSVNQFGKVKKATLTSVLNFSKSLSIIPSSTVKGLSMKMVAN